MWVSFKDYWEYSNAFPPLYVYLCFLIFFIVGTIAILTSTGYKAGWRYIVGLFLVEYIILLYWTTVFSRMERVDHECNLLPLWSYIAYFRHENTTLLAENILNLLAFVPIGMALCGFLEKSMTWPKAVMTVFFLSIGIEILQFLLMRGLSEFDDVMHNSMGGILGYCFATLIRKGLR